MTSYCEATLGLTYACDKPLPRSAFNTSGPLCESLAEYLYDPANCDNGHWCGCASTEAADCYPSNDISATGTKWGGYFTTTNSSGATVVFTGQFTNATDQAKCIDNYYCPGRNDTEICVDLCPPKFFCETPGQIQGCPKGKYCPVGTVTPKSCEALERCEETDLRRYTTQTMTIANLVVLILAIIYLFVGQRQIVRAARVRKEEKLAAKRKLEADEEAEDAEKDGQEAGGEAGGGGGEGGEDGVSKPEVKGEASEEEESPSRRWRRVRGTAPRRSTITAPEMTIDVEFEGLRLTIPGVGTIMRGVSGKIEHGNLTAVMGPSGAGKTTFLSLMSGKVDRTGGVLKINGKEGDLTAFRKTIGFVPQEDIMLRELTVEENVAHSALMRLPTNWKYQDKMERVDEILDSLEIDHIRDSVVGDEKKRGISGGQRKRVNIAMEMVVKPSLLCLDEPTSGLDSTTSYTVVNSLKDMARAGANVITVLHQPKYEVFELFDNVLLLGKGGMTVYYGPTVDMKEYFSKRGFPCPEHSNPADFYMDVLSGIIPHPDNPDFDKEMLFEEWMCADENPDAISPGEAKTFMEEVKAQDSQSKEEAASEKSGFFLFRWCGALFKEWGMLFNHLFSNVRKDESGRKIPGTLTQAHLLFKRCNLQRLRTPFASLMNIILMFLAGAVIPSLVPTDTNLYVGIPKSYNESNAAQEAYLRQNVTPVDAIPGLFLNVYLFLLIVSCLSVNVYGPERVVFFRETAVGQIVTSYWFAKTVECLLWLPIYTCAFVLIGYSNEAWFLQPLRSYWFFLFIALVGFYGVGMVASLLVGPGSAALLALVFGILIIVGFSGSVTAYGDQSSGYQTFINFWFVFWCTQGLSAKEYSQYTYAFDVDRLNEETPDKYSNAFGIGQQAVGAGIGMGFDLGSSYERNLGFAALTAFAWFFIVLWTLKTKDHRKHR